MGEMKISAGRCQFCHRTADDVEHLIGGDSGFIRAAQNAVMPDSIRHP